MVRKDSLIMKAGIRWIKQQMNDKRFRVLVIAGVAAGMILCAEFLLFSYSIPKILRYLILLESMFLIAWIDQRKRRIPNKILLAMLAARTVILTIEWLLVPSMGMALLISSIIGMLLGGGMFLLAHFLSRGGVGMGDVKLFAVIGWYVGGSSVMPLVFLTAVVSAVYSIVMLILKKVKLKEEIPFAPFVLAGTILTMALGM